MATQEAQSQMTLAKLLAAEDVQRGDFVAVLNEIHEYPSFLWMSLAEEPSSPHDPVRVQWRSFDNGTPLKVVDLCLPFVFVKRPKGHHETLDIRACQLVRLDSHYGKRVWKALRKRRKR
jgi:hypothetical protein